MSATPLELSTPEAQATGGRSTLYRALAGCFRSPSPEFHQAVESGQVAAELQQAIASLPYALEPLPDLGAGAHLSHEELQSAYMALFEVGGEHGSPCFLYEGEQGGGRMKVLEDALRFYHFFGLRLAQEKWERPDHLATELEFMHALSFREAALVAGGAPGPLRLAQRDFLRLHLADFATAVAQKTAGSGVPLYPALARCAASFCEKELTYLQP